MMRKRVVMFSEYLTFYTETPLTCGLVSSSLLPFSRSFFTIIVGLTVNIVVFGIVVDL